MPVANKKRELEKVLDLYYSNPVARVSIDAFLTIGVILFFLTVAIRPTMKRISFLIGEIKAKKEFLAKMDARIVELRANREVFLKFSDKLPLLDQSIPNTPQVNYSIKTLEKLASDLGISIESLKGSQIPTETDLTKLDFSKLDEKKYILTVTIVSDYPTAKNFIDELMKQRRIFILKEVEMVSTFIEKTHQKDLTDVGQIRTRLQIQIPYFYK